MTTFKIGDVVRLKSGGPDMTITSASVGPVHGKSAVPASWFDGVTHKGEAFLCDSLCIVDQPQIRFSKCRPESGDLFFVSIPPSLQKDDIYYLHTKLDKEFFEERNARFIILPFTVQVEKMTGEQADSLAKAILEKSKP